MDLAFSMNDNFNADDFESGPQGNCRRCQKSTQLMCMRCGDCYCSKRCQDMDWSEHRYICFPKPPLVKLNSVLTDENTPEIGAIEPVHLKEQLRIMAKVCSDFMQQLDIKFNAGKINECNGNGVINKTIKNVATISTTEGSSNSSRMSMELSQSTNRNHMNYNMIKRNGNMKSNEIIKKNVATKSTTKGNSSICNRNDMESTQSTNHRDHYANEINSNIKDKNSDKSSTKSSSKHENEKKNEPEYVNITGFHTSNRIGVCPSKYFDNGSYSHILQRINEYGRNAQMLKYQPKVNSFVVVNHSNNYVRAKVLPASKGRPDRIRLELVDFGVSTYRALQDLRVITQELENFPIYVKVYTLNRVEQTEFRDGTTKFLASFERKKCEMTKVTIDAMTAPDGKCAVELTDTQNGESINERISNWLKNPNNIPNANENDNSINGSNKSFDTKRWVNDDSREPPEVSLIGKRNSAASQNDVSVTPSSSTTRMLKPPFNDRTFSMDMRNIKAHILDASAVEHGYIACILEEHLPYLEKIQMYLENEMKNLNDEPYQPVAYEYVIARFEDAWYRAKVLHVSPENKTFDISYIDFLNEASLTSADIRRYPADLNIDCYTTLCCLDGLPNEKSEELSDFLKTRLEMYGDIHIDRVVDIVDDSVAYIECREILQEMRHKNLITKT